MHCVPEIYILKQNIEGSLNLGHGVLPMVHSWPFLLLGQGLILQARLALNPPSSCLNLESPVVADVWHYIQPIKSSVMFVHFLVLLCSPGDNLCPDLL